MNLVIPKFRGAKRQQFSKPWFSKEKCQTKMIGSRKALKAVSDPNPACPCFEAPSTAWVFHEHGTAARWWRPASATKLWLAKPLLRDFLGLCHKRIGRSNQRRPCESTMGSYRKRTHLFYQMEFTCTATDANCTKWPNKAWQALRCQRQADL